MPDELTQIATYMAHEMNANARGSVVRRMRELNSFSGEACIAEYLKADFWQKLFGSLSPRQCMDIDISGQEAAVLMWTVKVMQNADWDHKPKIADQFKSTVSKNGFWHAYDSKLYFYDVWSNIHYGYVGIAAGFSESTLLDGAGLEQIGSDLVRRRWPVRTPNVRGLRAYDDGPDRSSISIGIELYRVHPSHVTHGQVLAEVLKCTDLTTKPVKP
jgi:hypothetical protein